MAELAARAGHPLDLGRLDPDAFLRAMTASFGGDERSLGTQLDSSKYPGLGLDGWR